MDARLLELQSSADAAQACALAECRPEPALRGWCALVPLELAARCEGPGVEVRRGRAGALALGALDGLRAAALRSGLVALADGANAIGEGRAWKLPGTTFTPGRTRLMGVINVTPDSFSDGGRFLDVERAVDHGLRLVAEGADLLDVGGESTNPFVSQPVTADEERARVEPVIRALAARAGVPISVDTTKAEVAEAALAAGACIVNDVSGLLRDARLGEVVARAGAGLCLMHLRGVPTDMQSRAHYADLHGEVLDELAAAVSRARAAGVADARIAVDPGLGFAKTADHNLALLRRQRELLQLGFPLVVGASRKSFIGKLTDPGAGAVSRPASERLAGSLAAASLAAWNGALVVRVHDVRQSREALAVADAIRRGAVSDG